MHTSVDYPELDDVIGDMAPVEISTRQRHSVTYSNGPLKESVAFNRSESHDETLKSNSSSSLSTNQEGRKSRTRSRLMPMVYRRYESVSEDVRGTIYGPDDEEFRPEEASKALRKALSGGIQCDDKAITNIMLSHDNFQRQKIAAAYEASFNRKLDEDLEEETGGFFLDTVLALLQPAHVYSTRMLYYAISSQRHYNRSVAVEIALTSTSTQLKVIRDTYIGEFRTPLERDLNVKVEGLFGRMLQQLLLRSKDPENDVDMDLVDKELASIRKLEHGIEELGRNLDLFTRIFATQSLNQIRALLDRFDSAAVVDGVPDRSREFESIVRKSVNIHSDVRQMLLLFAKISRNTQLYFAEKLHEAISGSRPDHASIIRILVSRSEG
ncbi:CRE-NEX-4 protein [Aphelenchoides avenae]|nr:CRE-NEX-4 protein [Aphelenchus avenae]